MRGTVPLEEKTGTDRRRLHVLSHGARQWQGYRYPGRGSPHTTDDWPGAQLCALPSACHTTPASLDLVGRTSRPVAHVHHNILTLLGQDNQDRRRVGEVRLASYLPNNRSMSESANPITLMADMMYSISWVDDRDRWDALLSVTSLYLSSSIRRPSIAFIFSS